MLAFRKLLSFCSFVGLLRYFRLKLTGKELLVSGSCQNCGNCCRRINLEGYRGWLRQESDFWDVVTEYPEYERFQIMGKDKQGFLRFTCSWLTDEGYCQDHPNRLRLCRNFPDKALHFCGGTLPPGCGYTLQEVRPFDKYLEDEQKNSNR